MTSKSFSTEASHRITPSMEKSVAKAFNEFAPKQASRQFNGVLKRFPSSSACQHAWKPTGPLPREHADYIKLITEEEPPTGDVKWCVHCGAISYWENGQLWLFDATTRYFGKPPKRKRHEQRERQR